MLPALFACAPKSPPVLYPAAAPVVDVAPVADLDPLPGECTDVHPLASGDSAPCVGVLVGGVDLARYLEHRRRDRSLTAAYGLCVAGRESDRAWASDRYAATWEAWREADREARVRRATSGLAFGAGVGVGIGVVLGVFWAADRL